MKMTVSFPSGKPVPQLSAPGLEPRFAAGEDFWRIHLDTDEIRELTVFSADQAPRRSPTAMTRRYILIPN